MIEYTCDHCSQPIAAADRTLLTLKAPGQRRRREIDLCPGCRQAFTAWLEGSAGPAPTPRHKPAPAGV